MRGGPEDEASRWLREAGEELGVARYLADGEGVPARAACFHAHLAAEKALKALVLHAGGGFPRIHDLVQLEAMLALDQRPLVSSDDLDLLNPWAVEVRYPADLAEAAAERVSEVVEAASRVVSAAEGLVVNPRRGP